MLLLVLRYMIFNNFFKLSHLNFQKGILVLRELIIFIILSPRTRIQRIHTILIVFEFPSLAMYMLRESVILEADFKLRNQYFY